MNIIQGDFATIPGGGYNLAAGDYSFAAGRRAKANHPGAFVWADSQDADFPSARNNEFAVRASGGVRLETGGAWLTVDGRVGIGNAAPGYPLDVMASRAVGRFISTNDFYGSVIELRNDTPAAGLLGRINFYSTNTFHGQIAYRADNDSMTFEVAGAERLRIDNRGRVGIGTGAPAAELDVRGNTRTCVLTITGGCDLAEPFDTTTAGIPPGSVVVIDPSQPGKLKLSEKPYDRKVAGVVSGANGVNPGITLSQSGVIEGGINVALTGRVYVQADASNGSIEPGDLLTTSDTPGHGMKVTDYAKAQGAIIGKAMSCLENGRGLVLILVNLQ